MWVKHPKGHPNVSTKAVTLTINSNSPNLNALKPTSDEQKALTFLEKSRITNCMWNPCSECRSEFPTQPGLINQVCLEDWGKPSWRVWLTQKRYQGGRPRGDTLSREAPTSKKIRDYGTIFALRVSKYSVTIRSGSKESITIRKLVHQDFLKRDA